MDQVLRVLLTCVAMVAIAAGALFGLWMAGDDGDYVTDEPITVTLTIDYGDGDVQDLTVETVNATVYGVLLEAARPHLGNVVVKATYSARYDAILVDTIGHRTNGDNDMYWIFYVNDAYGTVAADRCRLEDGDHVEWRFESFG